MSINFHDRGKISLCSISGCEYKCCEFQQGNYIVLYPGELEDAKKLGETYTHLEIIDNNYHGGKRAICTAKDTSSCDNGYKPLDCASYPLFPKNIGENNMTSFIKGKKCPLKISQISQHTKWVYCTWKQLILNKKNIRTWLEKVDLLGYDNVLLSRVISEQRNAPPVAEG
jgi:hypothetical protein